MNINIKILSKQELVTCEVVIDGYLHTVSYQADTTNTIAKVLQFTDRVALITQGESPSYVLDPHPQHRVLLWWSMGDPTRRWWTNSLQRRNSHIQYDRARQNRKIEERR